jgi:hypothetical protein
MAAPGYILALLLALGFTLATWLQPMAAAREGSRVGAQNLIALVMGDAQRLFAGLFFRKADVYFHSGFYPSIFDQGRTNEMHIAEQAAGAGEAEHGHEEHEEEGMDFLKPPLDWIEALGRYSFNTEHTHLDENGKVGEMLPWLLMSAELDPQNVETYTVAAYWLRGQMKRPKEAEEFLRAGQRANPDSWEIPFELGQLYRDNEKDPFRARNLFELAARKLAAQEKSAGQSDLAAKRRLFIALSRLAESEGRIREAIDHLQQLHDAFPPESQAPRKELEKQIVELTAKLSK